ncbi:MAG: class IV adenylate cyclase [Bryobacteraceae bacterium]|nr:class IV adenylate cyclase [Bryobacteraceae bacterium]
MSPDSGMETEIKLAVSDRMTAEGLLRNAGFSVSRSRIFEQNSVYDRPDGSLRSQGNLLRLRSAGERSVLTWKGPEIPGPHKSRPETEVIVDSFEKCDQILQQLGFGVTFLYEKFRTEWVLSGAAGVATLDETPIGVFLELEGTSDWIDATAQTLGFRPSDYILESYGSLYFAFCREQNRAPGFMQFAPGFMQV